MQVERPRPARLPERQSSPFSMVRSCFHLHKMMPGVARLHEQIADESDQQQPGHAYVQTVARTRILIIDSPRTVPFRAAGTDASCSVLPATKRRHQMNKREFIRTAGGAGLGLLFGDRLWAKYATMPVDRLARQEDFWEVLRGKYRLTPDYINLENGYFSMQSEPVLEAFIGKVREVNYENTHYMRTSQVPDKLSARAKLAVLAGCAPDELIITRNTTESLDTV